MHLPDIEDKFLKIIKRKHKELNLGKDYSKKFSKIKDFEANAIGQIGEEFAKSIISSIEDIKDDSTGNDEYDIETNLGKKFEIKTARKGRTSDTFQFNGLNPKYNYDFLICLGITEEYLLYRVFPKSNIQYIHKERKHYVIDDPNFKKQLVQMNPDNHVNHKLTLTINDMKEISNLIAELRKLLKIK